MSHEVPYMVTKIKIIETSVQYAKESFLRTARIFLYFSRTNIRLLVFNLFY